jgi:alkylated DNA repair protein (DNA oxidative demethylase)
LQGVITRAPFRHMITPGGFRMSVAMTNCGLVRSGSRKRRALATTSLDPVSGRRWPPMPEPFSRLATAAADRVGFRAFRPDACLVNRYVPGAKLALHQDKDERDFGHPIVSVSLGILAVFLFGVPLSAAT